MKKFAFRTKTTPPNGLDALSAYTMWTKSHDMLLSSFPKLYQHPFYKKLMLYGAQRFWEATWFDRYWSAANLGDNDHHIDSCWAALIKYHLDALWAELDDPSELTMDQLRAIFEFTNRTKNGIFQGIGLAQYCSRPATLEGFIDIYGEVGNNPITRWARKTFLPE